MKNIKKILLVTLVAGLSVGVNAQSTQKLSAAKHNDYGLVYSLPRTHLRIEVEAEQTIKKAGPYYNYAKKYLGTEDVILKDSKTWNLKSVKVTSYGVPEKGNEYLMQFKAGSTPYLIVGENGMPLAINTSDVEIPTYEPKQGVPLTESVLENNAYSTALSGELIASGSLAKRAEYAANTIYKIRESRTNYAIGEADQMPPDGESLRLILEELNKQEKALMAMFLGTTQTGTDVKVFDYVPMNDTINEVVVRISDFNGITDKEDLSGAPVYLTLKIIEKGEIPLDEKGLEKKLPKGAVMYKIPGKASLSLSYEGKEIYNEIFDIAQFGVDYGLNPTVFTDKKAPSFMKFHPSTGGIKEIGIATPKTTEQSKEENKKGLLEDIFDTKNDKNNE